MQLSVKDIDDRLDSLGKQRNQLTKETQEINGDLNHVPFKILDVKYRKIESLDKTIKLNQILRYNLFGSLFKGSK